MGFFTAIIGIFKPSIKQGGTVMKKHAFRKIAAIAAIAFMAAGSLGSCKTLLRKNHMPPGQAKKITGEQDAGLHRGQRK